MLIIIVALKCEFKSWWRVILGFHPTLYVPFLRCHNTALEEKLEKNETECQNLSHLSLVFLYNNMGYYVNLILTTWDLQMKRYFGKTKILKYGFTLCCGMKSQMIFIWNHVIHTTFFVKLKGFFWINVTFLALLFRIQVWLLNPRIFMGRHVYLSPNVGTMNHVEKSSIRKNDIFKNVQWICRH